MHSVSKGHHDCTDILIKAGADVNWKDIRGTTACCIQRELQLFLSIIASKSWCECNQPTRLQGSVFCSLEGTSGIRYSIDKSRSRCEQNLLWESNYPDDGFVSGSPRLVESRADVNNTSKYGENALTLVSVKGHLGCMKFLLKSGLRLGNLEHFPFPRLISYLTTDKLRELLHAAGVRTLQKGRQTDISLTNLCRMNIRFHLLRTHSDMDLFFTLRQLGLSSQLQRYLLFYVSLDDDVDDNDNCCAAQKKKKNSAQHEFKVIRPEITCG